MRIIADADGYRAVPDERGGRLRVLLLRSDDAHHLYLQEALRRRFRLVGVVVEPGRAQQRGLWRRGRRKAWMWRLYQSCRQRLTGRAAYRRRYFAVDGTAPPGDEMTLTVESINTEMVAETVRGLSPDVVVVCGTGYIREETLASATVVINVHAGYLPFYRGNHGVYFAYEAGDFERIGASLHLVTSELDGGPVARVVRPEIRPGDDDEHLYCRSVKEAVHCLGGLLAEMESGTPVRFAPQTAPGRTYRHRDRTPLREMRLWLRRRFGRHPVPFVPAAAPAPRSR